MISCFMARAWAEVAKIPNHACLQSQFSTGPGFFTRSLIRARETRLAPSKRKFLWERCCSWLCVAAARLICWFDSMHAPGGLIRLLCSLLLTNSPLSSTFVIFRLLCGLHERMAAPTTPVCTKRSDIRLINSSSQSCDEDEGELMVSAGLHQNI